ncbi:MAG TPA: DUF5808 domain-containing protein [Pseudonocardiaceae bacterium]|nr:DUF5808 domain-containing protein [Pseudonocardiaceae bacterium]
MTPTVLIGYVTVPLAGVLLCLAPTMTRPTVPFGVRVPKTHIGDAVIRRERRGYQWRSAIVAICALGVLIAIDARTAGWPNRVVLIAEFLADLGCYWWARRRIRAAKSAEHWFDGQRQTVVADTSWRTEPPSFPVWWLLPAITVIVATVVIGVLRYPHLVPASPPRMFGLVAAQVYVTGLWSGLLVLAYRSRPELDTGDPATSLRGYRKALDAFARAGLTLLACIDLSLLLGALQLWQLLHVPAGAALAMLPFVLGLIAFLVTAVLAARERARTTGTSTGTDRDDDRLWKGGLIYVNRDDPAVVVNSRFGFGWTPNFGNRVALLLVGGIIAVPLGLVIIKLATGVLRPSHPSDTFVL